MSMRLTRLIDQLADIEHGDPGAGAAFDQLVSTFRRNMTTHGVDLSDDAQAHAVYVTCDALLHGLYGCSPVEVPYFLAAIAKAAAASRRAA